MLFAVALAREAWPKDIPVRSIDYVDESSYMAAFTSFLTEKATQVADFVTRIDTDFIPNIIINNDECDEYCEAFTEITRLQKRDYHLYNAFLEAVQDNMLAIHGQQFGLSLQANANLPFSDDVYDYILNNAAQLNAGSFTALVLPGYDGFFSLKTADLVTGFTTDFGACTDLPEYDENTFKNFIQTANTASAGRLLREFITESNMTIEDIIEETAWASQHFLFGIVYFSAEKGTSKYVSTQGDYTRDSADGNVFIQSSCRADLEKPQASDFRIYKLEQTLGSKYTSSTTLAEFYDGLRTYPFRTEDTAVLAAQDASDVNAYLSKCTSITDSSGICNCADPMVPTNWWVVSVSLLLIIATVVVWVFGYKFASRFDQAQEALLLEN